jgi:hypothetical protein
MSAARFVSGAAMLEERMNKVVALGALAVGSAKQEKSSDKKPDGKKSRKRRNGIFLLEQRVMYDGAAHVSAAAAGHHGDHHHHHDADGDSFQSVGSDRAPSFTPASTAPTPSTSVTAEQNGLQPGDQVVFVDSQIADYQAIVAAINPGVKVFVFDGTQDGLQEIAQDLQGVHGLASVDIITHGASDMVEVGTDILTTSTMPTFAADLAAIGKAVAHNGQIDLYGCDVAVANDTFIEALKQATGRNVAASTSPVGATALGGTWVLDATTGPAPDALPANLTAIQSFDDILIVSPQITGTTGIAATFDGGGAPVVLDSGITITDQASTTLAGATVSIGSGFIAGDTLNFLNQNGISGSFNSANGVLTLTGTATVAQYQAALDSVTYSFSPTNGDPTNGGGDTSRSISWTVTDGVASSTAATSTLDTVRVAPSVVAGATATFDGDGSAVALDSALTVTAPDSGGNLTSATVTISSGLFAGDMLNFTNQNGITGSFNAGNGVLTLTGTASVANYQAALESITYIFSPANNDPTNGGTDATRTISWTVNDGVQTSTSVTSTINLGNSPLAVQALSLTDAPVVRFFGGEGSVTIDSGLTISGSDLGGILTGATVTELLNQGAIAQPLAGDTLSLGNGAASETFADGDKITAVFSNGTLTLSGTASFADYQAALASVAFSFTPADGDPTNGGGDTERGFEVTITDGALTSAGSAVNNFNAGFSIRVMHTPPDIGTSFAAGADIFIEDGPPVPILPADGGGIAVSDFDSGGNLTGATVSIISGLLGDTLNFTNQNGITGSFNAGNGVLTLSGTASIGSYEAAIDSITYSFPTNGDPTGGRLLGRGISIQVTDGVDASNVATAEVVTEHAPPTVMTGATATFAADSPTPVPLDSTLTVTDPDSGTLVGATVSISAGFVAGDTLNFENGAASETFADGDKITAVFSNGTLTLSGTASVTDYQAALQSVTYSFSPANGDPTFGDRTITWTANDGFAIVGTLMGMISTAPEGMSVPVTSTLDVVDAAAPAITAVVGQPVNGQTVELQGTGEAGDTVTLFSGTTVVGTGMVAANGTFDISTAAFADGMHTFTATQTDAAGLASAASPAFTVNVDPTAPAITAVVGQPVNGGMVELQGTGEAGDTVTLFSGTTVVGTGMVGTNGTFDIPTTAAFADGMHTFTATQTDAAALTSAPSPAFTVNVDPTAPAITAVVGQPLANQTVELQGTGEAGDTVTLFSGTTVVGTGMIGAGGTFDIATTAAFADGPHTFTATQTDGAALASAASPAFTVNVDPKAPAITAVVGQPVANQTVELQGTGEAGDTVTLFSGTTVVGTGMVGAGGTFDITTKATFGDGAHTFTATQTDAAGLASAASPAFTVNLASGPPPTGQNSFLNPVLPVINNDRGSIEFSGLVTDTVTQGNDAIIPIVNIVPLSTVLLVHADVVADLGPNGNITFDLPIAALDTALGGDLVSVTATLADGEPLPSWLKLNVNLDTGTGQVACLVPDDIITSSTPRDDGVVTWPDAGQSEVPQTVTIEVVARDSKGNVVITEFTVDLATKAVHKNDRGAWNASPNDATRGAWTPYPQRDAALPLAADHVLWQAGPPLDLDRVTLARSLDQAPVGRSGFSDQIKTHGMHAVRADRLALLESLRHAGWR